ncbi:16S rRNA (cytosine(967)-C(5))-methyltransferase RsmB [Cohnella faecalis]|uniref:16S rRNA (cytosine(967)-C(5))-methyltransferase RsmB n=1 Tax=Cohnella faecalis TaxID=2315694 RepID=UPI001F1C717D|nr:16S rRNA (cytosine(967)-C(5))-methyltransferase RsmB [Cohnella faecalis]
MSDSKTTHKTHKRKTGTAAQPAATRKPKGPREVAMDILKRIDTDGAYSGLELNKALSASGMSRQDAALATEIVYGTIQRLATIDRVLEQKVKGWPSKVEPWARSLLRLSYYQLRWLDRVPAHAVVDEAVRLAKKRGHAGIAGLVNGVLRGVLRDGVVQPLPANLPPAERIALEHSYPGWMVERWIADYGAEIAEAICAAGNVPPHASARVNRLRTNRDDLLASMKEAGVYAGESPVSPDGIIATRAGSLVSTDWFKEGQLSIQDESSMLVAAVADPRPGMAVLDCCAAPGGKSMHLAERMENRGDVFANDVHPHKKALIDEQAERLGLGIVRTMTGDAKELSLVLPTESMDIVLLDAPCSGLGVIRRKPEIKWNKQPQDVESLSALQGELLQSVRALVKPGGTLVYSTCTVAKEENERAIRSFLERNPEFSLDPDWPEEVLRPLRQAEGVLPQPFEGMLQILPHQFGSDGFFIARMKRRA